jgi:type I restriction enzyme R subunit
MQLGIWFHRTFVNPPYLSGPFIPPIAPKNESEELKAELERLKTELESHQTIHQQALQQLQLIETNLSAAKTEQEFWEQMALETGQAKAALESKLAAQQADASKQTKAKLKQLVTAANTAADAVQLDETDTRKLIDEQLRQASGL